MINVKLFKNEKHAELSNWAHFLRSFRSINFIEHVGMCVSCDKGYHADKSSTNSHFSGAGNLEPSEFHHRHFIDSCSFYSFIYLRWHTPTKNTLTQPHIFNLHINLPFPTIYIFCNYSTVGSVFVLFVTTFFVCVCSSVGVFVTFVFGWLFATCNCVCHNP